MAAGRQVHRQHVDASEHGRVRPRCVGDGPRRAHQEAPPHPVPVWSAITIQHGQLAVRHTAQVIWRRSAAMAGNCGVLSFPFRDSRRTPSQVTYRQELHVGLRAVLRRMAKGRWRRPETPRRSAGRRRLGGLYRWRDGVVVPVSHTAQRHPYASNPGSAECH